MTPLLSIQLSAEEAAFLLQLLEFPEAERLSQEFGISAEAVKPEDYEKIIHQLEEAGLVSSDNRLITLEVNLLELLQACKYSSGTIRLESGCPVGTRYITYGYLSASGVIEVRWSSENGNVEITSMDGGLEELLTRMGTNLELPETTESSDRIQLKTTILRRLYGQLGSSSTETIQTILETENLMNTQAGTAVYSSFLSPERWGIYQVSIRGAQIHSNLMRFIGSPMGHWVFVEAASDPVLGIKVTETELIQSFYAVTQSTLSVLSPSSN